MSMKKGIQVKSGAHHLLPPPNVCIYLCRGCESCRSTTSQFVEEAPEEIVCGVSEKALEAEESARFSS
uniref:Uncharacterized protein n=1 Tax=Oryza sativa subsp. japonica TaxID=39947 RepID=Q7XIN1_ORYSJ|nr:hypothetical protein [Oryza sativa Japonica Group]BAD31441.1 hypothetical protein [Oryza sativa Japonica Group]